MLFIIPALLLLIYSLFDFKKAYFLYLLYSVIWAPQAEVVTIGGFHVILNMITSAGFLFSLTLYSWRKNKGRTVKGVSLKSLLQKDTMPFRFAFLLIGLSMFLSCFFSVGGFVEEFPRIASKYLQVYITIWITWYAVETQEEFEWVLKGLILMFTLAGIYGMLEYLIQSNPLYEYKQTIAPTMLPSQTSAMKRGYQITSFFDHRLGAGLTLALYPTFILSLLINRPKLLPWKKLACLSAFLCVICLILNKNRSAYLFFLLAILPCINLNSKAFRILAPIGIAAFIAALFLVPQLKDLLFSLFDTAAQKRVSGSSVSMRMQQFEACLQLVKQSPVFGLGEKFSDYISNKYTKAALGYESVWLEQLVKHGIVGIIVQLILMVYMTILLPLRTRSKELLFLGIAYWGSYTISTFLAFRLDIFYFFLFYLIKSCLYHNNPQKSNLQHEGTNI